jgi:copper transport protein
MIAIAALIAAAAPVWAHAELDQTQPAAGSTLVSAPDQVRLVFSEGVAVGAQGIVVLHADGSALPGVRAVAAGSTVTAKLPTDAPPDTYVVHWRALSDDGHLVKGTFSYVVAGASDAGSSTSGAAGLVGEHQITGSGTAPVADADAAPAARSDPDTAGIGALLRSAAEVLSVAGTALLVGGLALWVAASRSVSPGPRPRRQAVAGAVAATLGGMAALAVTAGLVGGGVTGLIDAGSWQQVGSTPSGQGLLLRVASATAAAWFARRGSARLGLAAGLVAVVAVPLAGHASTDRNPWLASALLTLHVLAAAVWAGGLVAVLPLLRPGHGAKLRVALRSLGLLAGGGVLVLALTGGIVAWRRVPDWATLTGTGYGQALIAKTGLLAVLLVLAALGLRASRPGQAHPGQAPADPPQDGPVSPVEAAGGTTALLTRAPERPPAAPAVLHSTVRAEVLILALVLATAGVLATIRPPAAPAVEPRGTAPAATVRTQATATGGTARFTLRPHRQQLGLEFDVTDAGGRPEDVVAVAETHPDGTVIPPTRLPLQRLADGRFRADPMTLASSGTWQVAVSITHADGRHEDLATTVTVP